MPRGKPKAAKRPTPVEAITHADKRKNLPPADAEAQDLVDPALENPLTFSYPRNLHTPQLVWRGKGELDLAGDLAGNAPPIYVQEKIDPRVLIENLRPTADRAEDEPELTLFESFDGLTELDRVEYYQHGANWSNRMILGDSLNVMASLAEREALRGKVQMIYIDPPYGIKFNSNWQVSARKRDVKDGKLEDATREVEQIKAFRDTWEYGINSYLTYLRDRLTVAKELLTETGSVFVQIGDENVHLVRSLMDEVFSSGNFVSMITFATTSGFAQSAHLGRNGDYILWYAKNANDVKARTLLREAGDRQGYGWLWLEDGSYRGVNSRERAGSEPLPEGARLYQPDNLQSQGAATELQPFSYGGRSFSPSVNSHWKASYPLGMNRLALAGRIHVAQNSLRYRRLLDDFPFQARTNLWTDTGTGNFTGAKTYVVQTNEKVIERCILLSSDPGDLVLDPTCGSGTTAVSAERWGRRWITVDTSRVALALARQRVMGVQYPYYILADSPDGRAKEAGLAGVQLSGAETTNDIRHGFVLKRVRHIRLESIANNPDIVEGMSREEIDAAIKRHAEYELLYDKPYEDKGRVRVAGPFTVESLSPHRALEPPVPANAAAATASGEAEDDAAFVQTIMANLRSAGIQNGHVGQRLEFDTVDTHAGPFVQAVGVREDAAEGTPRRVGIAVGPQYGTVGAGYIKDAARAAIHESDMDLLCVLGFAFDPAVLGCGEEYVTSPDGFANVAAERRLGRMPVMLVRMNADLVMGEELKKTGAGNLFTVFGEPDIEIKTEGDELRVVLHGVDVYDPNTGTTRSNDTDQIALWMIDTAYNGESFFVRHCYFTGGQKPYERLQKALKADIDADAWATLYRTESRSFARPDSGRIAVKVINDYGDEVMKVFTV